MYVQIGLDCVQVANRTVGPFLHWYGVGLRLVGLEVRRKCNDCYLPMFRCPTPDVVPRLLPSSALADHRPHPRTNRPEKACVRCVKQFQVTEAVETWKTSPPTPGWAPRVPGQG